MNALRGAIVVIVALVIGVVVLAQGLDESSPAADGGTATTAGEGTAPPAEPAAPPAAPATETTEPAAAPAAPSPAPVATGTTEPIIAPPPPVAPPTHNRNEVRVLVANGTSVCGSAGRLATVLNAEGYNVLPPVNADAPADLSAIYYVDEYAGDASVVASLIQVDSSRVLLLPTNPPTSPGDSHVLIHIGADNLAQPNC